MPDHPPVALVHGFASSYAHGWEHNGWTDLLADGGRKVLRIDLPGHGESPATTDPAAYADVQGELADVVAPHAPVDAIGFSTGARLLLGLASEDPARLRKLVVIGVGDNLLRPEDREPLARALESGPDEVAAEDIGVQLFVRLARTAGNDPRALTAFLRRPDRPLTEDDLARVTCPVLVVLGDRDFSAPADRLVSALPDAELVTLRNVDHFAAPRDFNCIDRSLAFIDL
ncbi:MAG TPA: alpha/beta fold hydrolase [Acidimicrobiales bacterium]|nr:alpha/beta fold hydrolase [Acidimicrobiales bacterium]